MGNGVFQDNDLTSVIICRYFRSESSGYHVVWFYSNGFRPETSYDYSQVDSVKTIAENLIANGFIESEDARFPDTKIFTRLPGK